MPWRQLTANSGHRDTAPAMPRIARQGSRDPPVQSEHENGVMASRPVPLERLRQ